MLSWVSLATSPLQLGPTTASGLTRPLHTAAPISSLQWYLAAPTPCWPPVKVSASAPATHPLRAHASQAIKMHGAPSASPTWPGMWGGSGQGNLGILVFQRELAGQEQDKGLDGRANRAAAPRRTEMRRRLFRKLCPESKTLCKHCGLFKQPDLGSKFQLRFS